MAIIERANVFGNKLQSLKGVCSNSEDCVWPVQPPITKGVCSNSADCVWPVQPPINNTTKELKC